MRSKFHKLFWIWQLDKEESWINDMAAHGYALVHAGRFCNYEFDEVEPGKYIYKSLFLKGSGDSTKNREYYRFLDEMGIETVSTFGQLRSILKSTQRRLPERYRTLL